MKIEILTPVSFHSTTPLHKVERGAESARGGRGGVR